MNRNIEHVWTVLCSNSSVDQETKNVSLFNIIEQIEVGVPKEIAASSKEIDLPFQFQLVTLWHRKDDKIKDVFQAVQQMRFLDPEGKELNSFTTPEFALTSELNRFRNTVNINGFKITTAGNYSIIVSIKENGEKDFTEAVKIPLQIEIKNLENGQS